MSKDYRTQAGLLVTYSNVTKSLCYEELPVRRVPPGEPSRAAAASWLALACGEARSPERQNQLEAGVAPASYRTILLDGFLLDDHSRVGCDVLVQLDGHRELAECL